jgi:hypothetical protein
LFAALTTGFYILNLRLGIPAPSLCVTSKTYWVTHERECAVGLGDLTGLRGMVDNLYLSGNGWFASLLFAIVCAMLVFFALVALFIVAVLR